MAVQVDHEVVLLLHEVEVALLAAASVVCWQRPLSKLLHLHLLLHRHPLLQPLLQPLLPSACERTSALVAGSGEWVHETHTRRASGCSHGTMHHMRLQDLRRLATAMVPVMAAMDMGLVYTTEGGLCAGLERHSFSTTITSYASGRRQPTAGVHGARAYLENSVNRQGSQLFVT